MADVTGNPALAHVRQLPDGKWIEHFLDDHLEDVVQLAVRTSDE